MTPRLKRNRRVFLLSLVPVALLLAFFWRAFSPDARFAQRDESFYYYPLFELVLRDWNRGVLPLWNPYDNLGQPLAGDPTASVFYPGKLVFALASFGLLSFGSCFKIYIVGHVALAYVSARKLAKRLGVSQVGSILSGVAYAFGGQTLYQYSNVIYLVGAAWAPFLTLGSFQFHFAQNAAQTRRALAFFSLCASMAILGGEPQIVYLALLLNLVAICLQRRKRPRLASFRRKTRKAATFFFATTILTFALSAVQILPSLEFAERSTRAEGARTRSLWSAAWECGKARLARSDAPFSKDELYDGVLCRDFAQGGVDASIYRFSVGPWRWLEFLFPNIGGRQFPQNERWFEAVPNELSVWTPTLYFGVFPCVLALSAMRLRVGKNARETRKNALRRVATYLVAFGLIGALGGYGLPWFYRIARAALCGEPTAPAFASGDPIGGLYWLLNLAAPKFAQFRYPAKLIVVASLGFSLLVGLGWDRRFSPRFKRVALVALSLSALGLLLSAAVATLRPNWAAGLHVAPNPLYGPILPEAAAKRVVLSFASSCVFLTAPLVLALCSRRMKALRRSRRLEVAILLIVGVDIYAASSWIVTTAPTKLFAKRSELERQISEHEAQTLLAKEGVDLSKASRDALPPTRVYRYPVWFPPLFQTESSPRRIEERVLWDGETLFPKRALANHIALLDSRGAATDAEFAKFLDFAFNSRNIESQLSFLGVSAVIGPNFWTERVLSDAPPSPTPDWRLDLQFLPPENASRVALFFNDDRQTDSDEAKLLAYTPNKRVYAVSAHATAAVIFTEQYWPDWRARLIPLDREEASLLSKSVYRIDVIERILQKKKNAKEIQIAPTSGFLQQIAVPQGQFCVVVEYKPKKFYFGAIVSLASWLGCVVLIFIHRLQKQ